MEKESGYIFYKDAVIDVVTGMVVSGESDTESSVQNLEWYQELSDKDKKKYVAFLKGRERDVKRSKESIEEPNQDTINSRFVFLDIDSVSLLKYLDTATEFKVFFILVKFMEYNKSTITFDSDRRAYILDYLGLTKGYLSVILKKLKKNGLILGSRGSIELNPFIVWQGDLKVRKVHSDVWHAKIVYPDKF
jgi:hypothetical protein